MMQGRPKLLPAPQRLDQEILPTSVNSVLIRVLVYRHTQSSLLICPVYEFVSRSQEAPNLLIKVVKVPQYYNILLIIASRGYCGHFISL